MSLTKPQAALVIALLVSALVLVNTVAMPRVTYFFGIPSFIVELTVGGVLGFALGGMFSSSTLDILTTFITAL